MTTPDRPIHALVIHTLEPGAMFARIGVACGRTRGDDESGDLLRVRWNPEAPPTCEGCLRALGEAKAAPYGVEMA